jgi:putative transposase
MSGRRYTRSVTFLTQPAKSLPMARRKECRIQDHLMSDHVHMLMSIRPKHSVAQIIGYIKGKSSILIARNVAGKVRNFLGHRSWARGYIRNQELADQQLDLLEP